METLEKYESLLEFICDEYDTHQTFHGHGEYARVAVQRFERLSGIRLGDTNTKMAAVSYLQQQGWIDIVSIDGTKLTGISAYASGRIIPTREGFLHVKERRKLGRAIMKVASPLAELLGRVLKGLSGR